MKTETKIKRFNQLSRVEKRKKIANDALKQLRLGYIKAQTGDYVQEIKTHSKDKSVQVQKIIEEKQLKCEVCAMGALLIGDIINRNDMTLDMLQLVWSNDIEDKLQGYFPKANLRLIEAAFEKSDVTGKLGGAIDAKSFGRKYKSEKGRLEAILLNIINSKDGLFHP